MKTLNRLFFCILASFLPGYAPAFATVAVVSFTPSHTSPQPIGKTLDWTATATDSGAGPLTFQFNIAPPGGQFTMIKDFNVGTLSGGTWTAPPFLRVPTGIEGTYQIQVVAKDFVTDRRFIRRLLAATRAPVLPASLCSMFWWPNGSRRKQTNPVSTCWAACVNCRRVTR
jgi:hypothetical protein